MVEGLQSCDNMLSGGLDAGGDVYKGDINGLSVY
jgi:hypothetical protein